MSSPYEYDDQNSKRSGEWSPDDQFSPSLRERHGRNWWRPIGIALPVMLALGGLIFVGAIVVLWIGMANYGSNK